MPRTIQQKVAPIASRPFATVSLTTLLELIVEKADREALAEFHNHRPCFRLFGGEPLRFIPFLNALRATAWAQSLTSGDSALLDAACDAVTDKFTVLPADDSDAIRTPRPATDCRLYFGVVLKSHRRMEASGGRVHPIEAETWSARLLQRLLLKHFRLSCLEARRYHRPGRSRYGWQVNGQAIHVWMPISLAGLRRRTWLEQHVVRPDPSRPGERERIQALIDEHFGVPRRMPLDAAEIENVLAYRNGSELNPSEVQCLSNGALATAVANEKTANIAELRPTIRGLGVASLRALIHDIFQAISSGSYRPKEIAERYGLKSPTMSRFAGHRWKGNILPDLWANTATLLTTFTPFLEVARETAALKRALEAFRTPRQSSKGHRYGQ